MINKKLLLKASKIKLLLLDVDGVLTDGRMYWLPDGKGGSAETKGFHSLDGIGLILAGSFGIRTGIITGRKSSGAERRAAQLGMDYAYQGFLSKLEPLNEILRDNGLKEENTAYMGDDLTDLPVLSRVGLACAPFNAIQEVKDRADIITSREGGNGAVREICDFILKAQGHWPEVLKRSEAADWPVPEDKKMKIVINSHGGNRMTERRK